MAKCETCGKDYEKAFQVVMDGTVHAFDCFQCAILMLAPVCTHCGTAIIGKGVERKRQIYCCELCARQMGALAMAGPAHRLSRPRPLEAGLAR